jgi:glyoxylase-like metal-dependent hydrolase (beta-lactamase superfamily II)
MFGLVPRVMWSRLVAPDDRNRIPVQTNCLLLRDGARTVLIETGYGDKWSEKEREIWELERRTVVDALAEVGVQREDITHVIVTHLHFDHAAGMTEGTPGGGLRPTFPRAQMIVQRREWEDALANRSTMTRTYLRSHLDPLVGQVRCVEGESEALPGIVVWPMPGHTWGQQAVRFDDGAGTVCFPGDVMPTANHVGSAFSMAYDMLPHENMLRKEALLARAEAEGWRLVLDHEPGHPVRRVARGPSQPDPSQPARFDLPLAELHAGRGVP